LLFPDSAISFLLILVIPWFGYTKGQIAGIITGLVIIGEVTSYVSIFILGKSFWEKTKGFCRLTPVAILAYLIITYYI
jgi:hypothetical protein